MHSLANELLKIAAELSYSTTELNHFLNSLSSAEKQLRSISTELSSTNSTRHSLLSSFSSEYSNTADSLSNLYDELLSAKEQPLLIPTITKTYDKKLTSNLYQTQTIYRKALFFFKSNNSKIVQLTQTANSLISNLLDELDKL